MGKSNNLVDNHLFDLVDRTLTNSVDEYSRYVSGIGGMDSKVSEQDIQDRMADAGYDRFEVEGDLEHLTALGFMDKDISGNGEALYGFSDDAIDYLEDVKDITSGYIDSISGVLES